jgi:hypothetical protein
MVVCEMKRELTLVVVILSELLGARCCDEFLTID